MKYRTLGDTGIQVSALCMGTMTFGRESDRKESAAIFNRCREAGINFIDCADAYNAGKAEEMLGEFMAGSRSELVITSKAYNRTGPDINDRGLSRRHIMQAAEQSLKRLGTDYIDIYFLHHPDELTPIEESLRALDDLTAQGKVLYTGASNYAAWQAMKALGICDVNGWSRFKCIQPMYNLVKRQAEVEILPMALSENLGVMCYSPLGGGLLSGKYSSADPHSSVQGRLDENKMYKNRYGAEWMHESAKRFCSLAVENGYNPVSLALAWVAAHPAVTAPIVGARNLLQLEDSLKAVEIEMTDELYAQISDLSPKPPPADDRSEKLVSGTS